MFLSVVQKRTHYRFAVLPIRFYRARRLAAQQPFRVFPPPVCIFMYWRPLASVSPRAANVVTELTRTQGLDSTRLGQGCEWPAEGGGRVGKGGAECALKVASHPPLHPCCESLPGCSHKMSPAQVYFYCLSNGVLLGAYFLVIRFRVITSCTWRGDSSLIKNINT